MQSQARETAMAAANALDSAGDIESFIYEYFDAWGGTDEDRIMSYYAENVTVLFPGSSCRGGRPFASSSFGPSSPLSPAIATW
jgi:ketosteroid isomerase-like protein